MKPQKLYYILTNTSDRNKFIQILKNSKIKPINQRNRKRRYLLGGKKCFRHFHLIYIDAEYEICKSRYGRCTVDYDPAVQHPIESHIGSLRDKAEVIISNNGSKQELFYQLDQLISKFI